MTFSAGNRHRLLAAVFLTALLTTLALAMSPRHASATGLAEKRAEAARIAAQVSKLDGQLAELSERFKYATSRLEQIDRKVTRLEHELEVEQNSLRVAQETLTDRIVTVYQNGHADEGMLQLAQAQSFTDFLDRIDAVDRVGKQDASIVSELKALRERILQKREDLKQVRTRQAELVKEVRSDRDEIATKTARRKSVLAGVNAEIRTMVEAARAREAAAAAAESRRRAAQLSEAPVSRPAPGPDPVAAVSASPPAVAASLPSNGRGGGAVSVAMQFIGTPYKWGGASPSTGFDCSGLVMYAYAQVGVSLPHSSYALWEAGPRVSRDQLQVGDLVFFSGLGHMGMYAGGGSFIHSPQTGDVVKVSSMSDSYATRNYVGAVRISS